MGRKKKSTKQAADIEDYRHDKAKRKNNPPAKIAGEGHVPVMPKVEYSYSPRRPPSLRFDPEGKPDKLPELLEQATQRPLTTEEAKLLADALRNQEPWLEWAGKQESQTNGFSVDPVAILIHERISAQAILKIAARQDAQRELFADPQQDYHEAVQFYQHDIKWTNRLILGDNLQVMASLAHREDLAGKVQMIYVDPPYGIKFKSNFQPQISKRTVEDFDKDLTRDLEMVKAYRDTWRLGLHSYLAYLRSRLAVSRELLADTGSIFVQISDDNVHHVRELMDEIFGRENFISLITFRKTGGEGGIFLGTVCDFILWYGRDRSQTKSRKLYYEKRPGDEGATEYTNLELVDGSTRPMTKAEISNLADLPPGAKVFATWPLVSPGYSEHNSQTIKIGSTENPITLKCPSNKHWTVGVEGTVKLWKAERLLPKEGQRIYKRYLSDFAATPLSNQWTDSRGELRPQYVVQTSSIIVQRCMLMTTDPGDLVLDPTCGSGTTAYVAEQWGRRWITIDTSRVAVAIARHRILTKGLFPYYELCEESKGPSGGFRYHSIPYISYSVVANNQNLDPILARHDQILDDKLVACNHALSKVTNEQRVAVQRKLWAKQNQAGKKSITDADRRRWELPKSNNWEHWTVPFDTDYDWPEELQQAVNAYRQAWRAKMDEVNECIAANAEQQELVDQPIKVKGVIRVSGPFTVESVQPPQMSLSDVIDTLSPIGGEPESLDTFASARTIREVGLANEYEVQNIDAYLDQMVRLLRQDGVRFPDNKQQNFTRLDRITGSNALHAEGRWVTDGEEDSNPEGRATVAVGFGPQYGPVTALQVEELIRAANRSGYDELVIAGFSFDGAAQAIIDEDQHPKLRVHQANIRPDVNPGMNGLLKEQPGSQLFTVFGQPRTRVDGPNSDGEYVVTMEGVDIYDPVSNTVIPTNKEKVAAWFIDGDYDGRTFCITQAFFPDRKAWDKLAKALKGVIDQDAFEAFSGTESLPFPAGKHKCVAVKVIDPRGNEVMQIHRLDTSKK